MPPPLTDWQKARMFDRLVEETNKPNSFETISSTGTGYYKLHVWASNKAVSFEDAVFKLLYHTGL